MFVLNLKSPDRSESQILPYGYDGLARIESAPIRRIRMIRGEDLPNLYTF
jgi:hypothetical protein